MRLSLEVTGLTSHFEPTQVFSAQMVERGKLSPDLFLLAAKQDAGTATIIDHARDVAPHL